VRLRGVCISGWMNKNYIQGTEKLCSLDLLAIKHDSNTTPFKIARCKKKDLCERVFFLTAERAWRQTLQPRTKMDPEQGAFYLLMITQKFLDLLHWKERVLDSSSWFSGVL
jgi:hypothetical protein